MLVLSRRVGERILVGDKVVVTVVRIGPNAVRLGIEAPPEENIVREELKTRTTPIQSSLEHVADLGRRRGEFLEADEVADAYPIGEGCENG